MIQIESLQIRELRGIRELTLTLKRDSFAVSGPNGSGKSGVVDAIQFALTGEIGRLKGSGTGDLTLADHGPHVEKRSDPSAASVCLNVYIPHLKKSASITRTIKKPKQPQITPADADVKAVFAELCEHPEIMLSRREIIKFIVTEASQRSRDVQTLLKLDDIDQTRATLKTTENKLTAEYSTARSQADSAEDSLKRHLDLPVLQPEDVLTVVNKRRKLLGLLPIAALSKDTDLADGLASGGSPASIEQSKESALSDIKGLLDATAGTSLQSPTPPIVKPLVQRIAKIEDDPSVLDLIKRHSLIQTGLALVDGAYCPLCDDEWEPEKLRAHLREKLKQSNDAQRLSDELLEAGRIISAGLFQLRGLIGSVMKISETAKEFSSRLGQWSGELLAFSESLSSVEGIMANKTRFEAGWPPIPKGLVESLNATQEAVKARPDKNATNEANSFLVLAQERWNNLRLAMRTAEEKQRSAALGKATYKIYNDVSEAALTDLYKQVEGEFGEYYRLINYEDESGFKAEFEPAEGKLGLLVDFHKRGMFPPAAYHSEGHQDGMGVCLYLALMKRVLGDRFTFAVLDDVVMSVDSQHRKQFCKLLKAKFPNTQFVITTHDQVWAKQLRSEGLIGPKSAVAFHTWKVETGPVLDEVSEVWDQVEADLAKNDIPNAAGRLRRHMEYVAADLADQLGAKVKFRADGGYDMGELLGAVISRQGELLKHAAKAARSWDDAAQSAKIDALQRKRTEIMTANNGEQWIINKAIHYNEWADLSKNDFKPVVATFRQLLQQFRCEKPQCDSWMSLTPRVDPVDLRCSCGTMRLNLKEK